MSPYWLFLPGSNKITLRYFSDTKREIDEFFSTASEIVEGRRYRLLDKPAMKAITDGCSTSADVAVKKSDFYHLMQFGFGIQEDPHDDYYDEECFFSNLESFEYEDEADKKKKKELAIKLVSHINKLRGGNRYNSDIDSEHLIVTNTRATLLIAKEQISRIKEAEGLEHLCDFAVSLEKITSLLWYKLGNGFNQKVYPTSISAVLKARVVLSASIAKKAEKAFSTVKKQFEDHDLTEDQVAARIIMLRKKPTLPEDLQGDDIVEIMDFSPEYLSRYEEQFKQNQTELKEKDSLIETLKIDSQKAISKKNATIASQEGIIKQKDDENTELRGQLEEYRRRDEEAAKKKERIKNRWKFAWNIIWKIALIVGFTAAVIFFAKRFSFTVPTLVYTIIDAFALVGLFWNNIKNAKQKYFPKDDTLDEKKS